MTARPLAALCLIGAAAAALPLCFAVRTPDAIRFSHRMHIEEEEVTCAECHGAVAEATDNKASHRPGEAACLECHERDNCGTCHTNPKRPAAQPRPPRLESVRFDHKQHVAVAEGDCGRCHAAVIAADRPSDSPRPEMMGVCMSCHRQDFRRIACQRCHDDFRPLKEKPFGLFDHGRDFLHKHGTLARGDMVVCSHCHQESSCNECHSRMAALNPAVLRSDEPDRPLNHRGPWAARHAIEARATPGQCVTCHTTDSCRACHRNRGVTATGAGTSLGPHPGGWLERRSGQFHGVSARRDASSCAACHDRGPDTNCVTCHRVGAAGGNPHPPGFSSRISATEGIGCVYCHSGGG